MASLTNVENEFFRYLKRHSINFPSIGQINIEVFFEIDELLKLEPPNLKPPHLPNSYSTMEHIIANASSPLV